MRKKILLIVCAVMLLSISFNMTAADKTRVIVTTDGEVDDQCSLVRFLLYSNDFDVEGIIKSSSQYHAQDNSWAGDYWEQPIMEAYAQVYPNLIKHDPDYPTPEYLQSVTKLGNVKTEGEMSEVTAGSQHIVDVLLDETDNRPVWLQAWGGPNTIARALKTIEETHPEKMAYVAGKIRFYFIWEQDDTFQSYIRPHWATPYNIQTIISDQFITFGYWWQRWDMPEEPDSYFRSPWMKENIFKNMDINPLIAYYNERTKDKLGGKEDFIGEGDSPSFIHEIPTGLRSTESPDWGGWGGRYVLIRENTWLDKVPEEGYSYPSGRWYTSTGWGRQNYSSADQELLEEYFKPITRWVGAIQNDFAARVDWCVKSYSEANHQPVVSLAHPLDIMAQPGYNVQLSAQGSHDPDGDQLSYTWWQYTEAGSYNGSISIQNAGNQNASFTVPADAAMGQTIHIICQVTDNGTPSLTRYQRVVVTLASCNPEPVSGVSVSPATASVAIGGTAQLTATVAPECAGNKNVSWSSSNTSVATVNSSGLVTGVAAGTAVITVTTEEGGKTATSAITVRIPVQYTLTTSVTGQGSVSGAGTYNEGTVVSITATPASGYKFSGWSGDLSGSTNPATLTMDSDKSITANFTEYADPIAGYSYCSNENQTCTFSGTVNVAYGANDKYNFLYGLTSGSVSCNNSTFGDPISGVVKACYVKQVGTTTTYVLSTSTNGQGSINPSSGTYEEGTSVSLTATPAGGWQFDSWSGDASGSGNPVSIAMDGNKSVTANFSEIPVNCDPTSLTSNIQVNGGSWVQSTSATVSIGDAVKFGPHPTTGGSWSWSGPNGYSASSREIELTNLQTSQAGTYTAIYTNDCGTQSSLNVVLTVQSGGTTITATIQENTTGFCSVDGSVDNNNAGFTGTGFANTDNAYGNGITWSVDIPAAGTYSLVWRYANGGSTDRTAQLMEDGSTIASNVSMPSTGSWGSWAETPVISANLSAGTKLIRLQATNPSGLSNVDYMTISGGNLSAVACTGLKGAELASDIAEVQNDLGIKFYPVPVDNMLNIEFSEELTGTVEIYLLDITGKTIRSAKAKGLHHTLDMSGLPKGLYTVRILGTDLNTTKRVVKQ